MPDIHLVQWTAAFVLAMGLSSVWLLRRPQSRWRHIVVGLISTLLWIPVAYTAGNVGVVSEGQVIAMGSDALAIFAVFMAFVDLAGLLLGLLLWAEEDVEETSQQLPQNVRVGDR